VKTILRIVKNETFSAYILIPVGLLAIAIGSHWNAHFLEQMRSIAGWHFTIREFTLDYLLGFFFYSVGLQLRFEVVKGALQDRKVLFVSAFAAAVGMAAPALFFYLFNRINGTPTTGWGITMATDLPFVLAMLVVLKRSSLKGFVLSLATIDDIGSVIVLSIVFHVKINIASFLLTTLVLAIYFLVSRYLNSKLLLVLLFVVGLAFGHQSGIQTSLVAVLFGLLTSRYKEEKRGFQENMLNVIEPLSAYIVIPVFVFITLFRRYNFSWHATTSTLVVSLIVLRLIGKPLGIFLGAWLAKSAIRLILPFSLWDLLLIGALGTLGLDVSLIFAQKNFVGGAENLAIMGILFTIPLAVILSTIVHLLSPSRKTL
jgi:Na+:H+ antiporter, NhaA family